MAENAGVEVQTMGDTKANSSLVAAGGTSGANPIAACSSPTMRTTPLVTSKETVWPGERQRSPDTRSARSAKLFQPTQYEELVKTLNLNDLVSYCQQKELLPFRRRCDCANEIVQRKLARNGDAYVFRCGKCRMKKSIRWMRQKRRP